MAAGISVGRYNSPHLLEPRDAVRINGEPVAADRYAEAVHNIERVGASMGLTKFESATAAALDLINRAGVDIMIIECGMGGARDATNVLPPDLVLATGLTAVGLDHTAFLGNTVEEITSDKAQIAVPDAIMVVGVQPFRSVYDTASQVCQGKGAKLIYTLSTRVYSPASGFTIKPFKPPSPATICVQVQDADGKFQDLPIRLPLAGAHQVDNLALVVTMLDALRKDPRACAILGKLQSMADETIQKGIAATKWEGRCSWIEHPHFGPLLLDGAHNADSATTLRRYIDSLHLPSKTNLTFVLGLSDSKGKSPDSVLAPLLHTGDGVAVVGFSPVEGMPWVSPVAKEVVERAATGLKAVKLYNNKGQSSEYARQGKLDGGNQSQMDELAAALEWAKKRKGLTVVCGSLYLVADAYRLLKQ
jgi:folylpolyglutamate synthase